MTECYCYLTLTQFGAVRLWLVVNTTPVLCIRNGLDVAFAYLITINHTTFKVEGLTNHLSAITGSLKIERRSWSQHTTANMDTEKGNDTKFLFDYTSSLFHLTPLRLNPVFFTAVLITKNKHHLLNSIQRDSFYNVVFFLYKNLLAMIVVSWYSNYV